uniref:Uncharacterized protein n=1 Tax=Anopheles farauti TaxID=69004 RepID=A0A182QFD7_9DIPT
MDTASLRFGNVKKHKDKREGGTNSKHPERQIHAHLILRHLKQFHHPEDDDPAQNPKQRVRVSPNAFRKYFTQNRKRNRRQPGGVRNDEHQQPHERHPPILAHVAIGRRVHREVNGTQQQPHEAARRRPKHQRSASDAVGEKHRKQHRHHLHRAEHDGHFRVGQVGGNLRKDALRVAEDGLHAGQLHADGKNQYDDEIVAIDRPEQFPHRARPLAHAPFDGFAGRNELLLDEFRPPEPLKAPACFLDAPPTDEVVRRFGHPDERAEKQDRSHHRHPGKRFERYVRTDRVHEQDAQLGHQGDKRCHCATHLIGCYFTDVDGSDSVRRTVRHTKENARHVKEQRIASQSDHNPAGDRWQGAHKKRPLATEPIDG